MMDGIVTALLSSISKLIVWLFITLSLTRKLVWAAGTHKYIWQDIQFIVIWQTLKFITKQERVLPIQQIIWPGRYPFSFIINHFYSNCRVLFIWVMPYWAPWAVYSNSFFIQHQPLLRLLLGLFESLRWQIFTIDTSMCTDW